MVKLEKQMLEYDKAEDAALQQAIDKQDLEIQQMKETHDREQNLCDHCDHCDEYYECDVRDESDFSPEYIYKWKAIATAAIAAGVTCIEIFANGGAIGVGAFATLVVWWS